MMEIITTHNWTEWLTKEQILRLLDEGELEVPSPAGTLRLFVNFADRVAVHELLPR